MVLILILMEHAQRVMRNLVNIVICVLILILMEHAQRVLGRFTICHYSRGCLNPYFNGTCSKSSGVELGVNVGVDVLILILMEHAQREQFL